MSKRLGGIKGCKYKTSSFPDGNNIIWVNNNSIMSGRSQPLYCTLNTTLYYHHHSLFVLHNNLTINVYSQSDIYFRSNSPVDGRKPRKIMLRPFRLYFVLLSWWYRSESTNRGPIFYPFIFYRSSEVLNLLTLWEVSSNPGKRSFSSLKQNKKNKKQMPNRWRTIESVVHKIRLHGRRGKGMAESNPSREKK